MGKKEFLEKLAKVQAALLKGCLTGSFDDNPLSHQEFKLMKHFVAPRAEFYENIDKLKEALCKEESLSDKQYILANGKHFTVVEATFADGKINHIKIIDAAGDSSAGMTGMQLKDHLDKRNGTSIGLCLVEGDQNSIFALQNSSGVCWIYALAIAKALADLSAEQKQCMMANMFSDDEPVTFIDLPRILIKDMQISSGRLEKVIEILRAQKSSDNSMTLDELEQHIDMRDITYFNRAGQECKGTSSVSIVSKTLAEMVNTISSCLDEMNDHQFEAVQTSMDDTAMAQLRNAQASMRAGLTVESPKLNPVVPAQSTTDTKLDDEEDGLSLPRLGE